MTEIRNLLVLACAVFLLSGCKLGGEVSGLNDSAAVTLVESNSGKKVTITQNGAFQFEADFPRGASYKVNVARQPQDQTCDVANGEGIVQNNVNNVVVTCEPVFACPAIYAPVCGKLITPIQCVTTPCVDPHVYRTFGNRCELDNSGGEFAFANECGAIEDRASNIFEPVQIVAAADIPEPVVAASGRIEGDQLIMTPNQPSCDGVEYDLYIDNAFQYLDVDPPQVEVSLVERVSLANPTTVCNTFAPVEVSFDLLPLQAFFDDKGGVIEIVNIGTYRYGDSQFGELGDACGNAQLPQCGDNMQCRFFWGDNLPVGSSEPGVCWPEDDPSKSLATRLEELQLVFEGLTEDKSCDLDFQCQTLALGERPCGGPKSYMVYSTSALSIERQYLLGTSLVEYNLLDRQYNEQNDPVSTCEIILEPSLACVNNQCVVTNPAN